MEDFRRITEENRQGVAGQVRRAAAQVRRGATKLVADAAIARGEQWLDGLGERRRSPGFAEEVEEVLEALGELRQASAEAFGEQPVVCLLKVPRRYAKFPSTSRASIANVLALSDAAATGRDPGRLLPLEDRPLLPSIEVRRYDQGWVQRTRRRRARVETAYELVIGGRHHLYGSKRYVMRQAHWALMCDQFGRLPALEQLTGLAKRRALHKARRDRRKQKRAAEEARSRKRFKRRVPNWVRKLGEVMSDSIWRSLTRPSAFPRMLAMTVAGNSPGKISVEATRSSDGSGPWYPVSTGGGS